MAFNLITKGFKVNQADQFFESFSEIDNTYYYMFFGNHVPWPGGVVPEVTSSIQDLDLNAFSNMQFAKLIKPDDVAMSILRVDWTQDTVYDAYDHRVDSERFYVGVQEGSNYNVFKCLFNNDNAPSTVAPSFAAFSLIEGLNNEAYDGYYETSDGYQWKYMFTVDSDEMTKFSTTRYVPYQANTLVESFAVPGAIDAIKIENPGAGYDNHFNGEFVTNSDVGYLGNTSYFAIRTSNGQTPSALNDYYNGCIMKIVSGKGIGQYKEVVDYVNSGNARYVVLDGSFPIMPDTTSAFEITPKIEVFGSFSESVVARAIIGSSNSVVKAEILNRGAGYIQATAAVVHSNVISVSNTAVLTPIIPPPGGHGSNPRVELDARWVSISVTVNGDENGMIPAGQKFSQVGVLKDPVFGNVEFTTVKLSNTASPGRDGGFAGGETLIVFDPVAQRGVIGAESGNNIVSLVDGDLPLDSIIYPNNRVFLKSTDEGQWFTSTITLANNSSLVLNDSSPFTGNAEFYISYSNSAMTHVSSGPTWSNVTKVDPSLVSNTNIIGLDTYSTAKVINIQINNNSLPNLDVVNQLSLISIDDPNGSFVEDDYLEDSTKENSCYFHSYANANHLYVTRVAGTMSPGTVLRNSLLSASISVANKYDGQIKPGSGSVIYLENHEPVSRDTSVTQTKKLIVEF